MFAVESSVHITFEGKVPTDTGAPDTICNWEFGLVVPMPTLLLVDMKRFAVEAATPELVRYTMFPALPLGAGPVAPTKLIKFDQRPPSP